MRTERRGASGAEASSTRLLSTEELFEGFNELYESAESESEAGAPSNTQAGSSEGNGVETHAAEGTRLEITESGDAFNVRAELRSFDSAELAAHESAAHLKGRQAVSQLRGKVGRKAKSVLRAIDMLADADRENITATLKGGMLELKLPKSRVESLAAARSALLGSVVSGRPRGA